MEEEFHLTVDVQIIMFGMGMSPEGTPSHTRFLSCFRNRTFLALDTEKHIRQLYENRLGTQSKGRIWLEQIVKNGRFKPFPLGQLPTETRVKLEKAHFDPDDIKYIRLAISTPSGCLVSEDDDYSTKVCRILKKKGVHVHTAESACQLADQANQDPPPSV
jgi:hypothetical protein